ncbi:MAG TPA: signal peptidase I [Conexibacter sp.]|nr:signal peptidase I [Conexibacter sp.]
MNAKSGASSLVELVLVVAIALGIALVVQAFIVKPYRIPSGSMEPTLAVGERVIVNRIGNRFAAPGVGDIVVFHPPHGADTGTDACGNAGQGPFYDGPRSHVPCDKPTATRSSQNFIKRVVGLPGDRIAIRDGHVVRNGVLQREPFIRTCGGGPECNLGTITIPLGDYFMMGDNRGASDDSRFWGPVPRGWIVGDAFLSYWPPSHVGLL